VANRRVVVLAGGTGKRFWPLSREASPKQLLSLFGSEALICEAVARGLEAVGGETDRVAVLTGERLADEVQNTLTASDNKLLHRVRVLVEPLPRGTAVAIALAAATVESEGGDELLILPTSRVVTEADGWRSRVDTAFDVAGASGLVELTVDHATTSTSAIWAGRAATYLKAMSSLGGDAERIVFAAREVAALGAEGWDSPDAREVFEELRSIGFHELMEGLPLVTLQPLDLDARCVGDFRDLSGAYQVDTNGTVRLGRGVDIDTRDSIVVGGDRLVATLGLSDTIVVDSPDATLVCAADRAPDVPLLVARLAAMGAPEVVEPRTSLRPWGSWTSLFRGPSHQVKILEIAPGGRPSLQKHAHRSEHWIVASGTAFVTCDESMFEVGVNKSAYIPLGAVHRIENRGREMLRVIEVQVGEYLGEDDIVRLEDDWARG